nr:glycosyltransferase [uncultured Celeribacter sp.]
MRICLVSETFRPQEEGGAEISSSHAARNLTARGHEVTVMALGRPGDRKAPPGRQDTAEAFALWRVPYHNLYLPGPKPPSVSRLQKWRWHGRNALGAVDRRVVEEGLREGAFDVVYAQNCSRMLPALYQEAGRAGVPVCQHLRDYALLCPRASMYRTGGNCSAQCHSCRLLSWRARRASAMVTSVIAVSDFLRKRVQAQGLFHDKQVHVLHNTNMARADLDTKLLAARPEPCDPFTFGYLGALAPAKGIEVLLDAFAQLPANLSVRLLIAGRGEAGYVARLKARYAALSPDRLVWLGHVPAAKVYAQSEAIVVPSLWHEPLSRVPIEAASYGLPVIVAARGGLPEIVASRQIGWMYPATDVSVLNAYLREAARAEAAAWRAGLAKRFAGLSGFDGTAEATGYYDRVEAILHATIEEGRR